MFKKLILAGALLAASLPALADSWDSNRNIERAMDAALATYRKTGVTGLVQEAENCYAGLDTSRRNKHVGRDVEYCISYVVSSAVIDKEASRAINAPQNEYFTNGELLLKAMYALERARIVTRPEEFQPYLAPRLSKISGEMPRRF
jgi:hypothetical protein